MSPNDAKALAALCGEFDRHVKQIEQRLNLEILHRGTLFSIFGDEHAAHQGATLIEQLYQDVIAGKELTPDDLHLAIQEIKMPASPVAADIEKAADNASTIKTKKATIKPRGASQQAYVNAVRNNDINFGVGPAGTGKTYLAVACAVEAYMANEIERILLVRPAVEAGEKLGFLPGDLSQKVDPYLRPLYDALYEMMGVETVGKMIEKQVIEIAPLAYMRGRTLNNCFVILDESQNTTREQMKMFLTRIGFGTTAVITGDPSQVDLPRGQASGLSHALEILKDVKGISIANFSAKDVVRHSIVQRIVEAYEKIEKAVEVNEAGQP